MYFILTVIELVLEVLGDLFEFIYYQLKDWHRKNQIRWEKERIRREHLQRIYDENRAASAGAGYGYQIGKERARERLQQERQARNAFNRLWRFR